MNFLMCEHTSLVKINEASIFLSKYYYQIYIYIYIYTYIYIYIILYINYIILYIYYMHKCFICEHTSFITGSSIFPFQIRYISLLIPV